MEVNDLIYEQSIDLGLSVNYNAFLYQEILFDTHKLNYIFASHHMRDYVVEKYNIPHNKTQVAINGAQVLKEVNPSDTEFETLSKDVLKFVYAGTSQKGRGIEQLLDVFKNLPHYLIFIGEGGEWISELNYKNILYLGAYSENEAANLISHFDMGVVHYDDSKLYYNICHPTKYAFYLSAGLPILSTKLEEAIYNFNSLSKQVCIFENIELWKSIIENLNHCKIHNIKQNVNDMKNQFLWHNLLSKLTIDNEKNN